MAREQGGNADEHQNPGPDRRSARCDRRECRDSCTHRCAVIASTLCACRARAAGRIPSRSAPRARAEARPRTRRRGHGNRAQPDGRRLPGDPPHRRHAPAQGLPRLRRGRRDRLPRVRARVPDRGASLGRLGRPPLQGELRHHRRGPGGTRVTHKGWITELWERRAGRWLLVWEQATAIPNNFDLFLQSIEPPA